MGESDEELVDVAFSLRALEPDSVPVNFLMPFPGTPLAGRAELTPARCLRVLAMFRFVFPRTEVRIAGGREMHLRSLQPLGLHIANSIFLGDYLTSEGAPGSADLQMIADAGFVVEGAADNAPDDPALSGAGAAGAGAAGAGAAAGDRAGAVVMAPTLRRRGPGTALPGNA
jgi:biotin synthase